MYSERTHTGINLIDLTDRQVVIIRESLRRTEAYCILSNEERREIDLLRSRIDAVDPFLERKRCSIQNTKSNE